MTIAGATSKVEVILIPTDELNDETLTRELERGEANLGELKTITYSEAGVALVFTSTVG